MWQLSPFFRYYSDCRLYSVTALSLSWKIIVSTASRHSKAEIAISNNFFFFNEKVQGMFASFLCCPVQVEALRQADVCLSFLSEFCKLNLDNRKFETFSSIYVLRQ